MTKPIQSAVARLVAAATSPSQVILFGSYAQSTANEGSEFVKKPTALGISRSGGAWNPHVFQYTLWSLCSGGTRPPFARNGFFTNSQSRPLRLRGDA
ncbi:MAG: hypothetical protein ACREYF_26060 [Gammaproteobacteria bacterium]